MHIIVNWSTAEDVELVREEDGTVMLFNTYNDAHDYAREEMNFFWDIVSLD